MWYFSSNIIVAKCTWKKFVRNVRKNKHVRNVKCEKNYQERASNHGTSLSYHWSGPQVQVPRHGVASVLVDEEALPVGSLPLGDPGPVTITSKNFFAVTFLPRYLWLNYISKESHCCSLPSCDTLEFLVLLLKLNPPQFLVKQSHFLTNKKVPPWRSFLERRSKLRFM